MSQTYRVGRQTGCPAWPSPVSLESPVPSALMRYTSAPLEPAPPKAIALPSGDQAGPTRPPEIAFGGGLESFVNPPPERPVTYTPTPDALPAAP